MRQIMWVDVAPFRKAGRSVPLPSAAGQAIQPSLSNLACSQTFTPKLNPRSFKAPPPTVKADDAKKQQKSALPSAPVAPRSTHTDCIPSHHGISQAR